MQTDIHQGNQALKSEGDGIRTRNHRIDRRFLAKAEKAQNHGISQQFTATWPVCKGFHERSHNCVISRKFRKMAGRSAEFSARFFGSLELSVLVKSRAKSSRQGGTGVAFQESCQQGRSSY
jgi:hypothetical protein